MYLKQMRGGEINGTQKNRERAGSGFLNGTATNAKENTGVLFKSG